MARRVASSSVMSLLSVADSSSSMSHAVSTCVASTRWPPRERFGGSRRRIMLLRKAWRHSSSKAEAEGRCRFCSMGVEVLLALR
eukprot:743608-Pleurochrysis_carterae.AAC.1